jgi:outer membrane receptor for ferrienterochelin and colicins
VDRATIKGVELSGRWQATRSLAFKTNYTFTDSRQKGGSYDGYALARTPRTCSTCARTGARLMPGRCGPR